MVEISIMAHSGRQGTRSGSRAAPLTRAQSMRRGLRELFTGTSVVERTAAAEERKAPRLELPPQDFSSASITLPHLFRAATVPATFPTPTLAVSPHTPSAARMPITSRPITPISLRHMQRTMSLPLTVTQRASRPFVGVDPEEQYLADLAARGRRRQSKRSRGARKRRSCVIDFKNRKVRSKVIACCLSAIFLMIVLTIYLALALSNREESQEFHVLLILVILLTTIFFCHALISLCVVAIHAPNEERPRMSLIGPGGFANPPRPIPVALARDEEAAGIESEATRFPPPAYGLWRESVRVDPDRIFWQRTAAARTHNPQLPGTPETDLGTQRPPSYISEDGVAYVIEAAPRSIAPAADVPIPPHPSERGRIYVPPHS